MDAIRERWAAGDRAAAPGQVSDAMIRELMLVGGPDEIGEGLQACGRTGLRTPVLAPAGGDGAGPGPLLAELVKP